MVQLNTLQQTELEHTCIKLHVDIDTLTVSQITDYTTSMHKAHVALRHRNYVLAGNWQTTAKATIEKSI